MLGATLLLWLLWLPNPVKPKIQKIHWKRFVWCALLGITVNQLLFIKGLSMTYSIHASLLMLTTPILVTILASLILGEQLTLLKITGLLLGACGATILILGRKNKGMGMNVILGDAFVIINAICYSYYFVLVKPLMKRYSPIMVLRVLFTIGTFAALPVCWNEFSTIPWEKYENMHFMLLALIVVGGTFFAYLFNIYGIKHLGPSISGSYIYTQPVFAAVIAMIVLHEPLDYYKLIAAAFIFTGVYLTNRSKRFSNG